MKLTKKIALLLAALSLILFVVGCESDSEANKSIIFEIDSVPKNIDPQLASNDAEVLIVQNTFEGLCRVDENGEVLPGAAEKLSVSGNTYTFTIRKNAKWSDGSALTAEDFLFGIKRALLPETKSPFAEKLYSIKNAENVHKSQISADKLGISAPDEKTLIIELSREDNDFLYALATSGAMPCKEEFFKETKGRYGLSKETILTNGAFFVRIWDTAKYVRINRSGEYKTLSVRPSAVVIYFSRDPLEQGQRLMDGRADAAMSKSTLGDAAVKEGLEPEVGYNTLWALVLNPENKVFKYPEIRKAFLSSLEPEIFTALTGALTPADGFVPPGLTVREAVYRQVVKPEEAAAFSPEQAKTDYLSAVIKNKLKVDEIEILYPDTPGIKDLVSRTAQSWQKHLSVVVNIKSVTSAELKASVSGKTFTAALIPVSASDSSAKSFLSLFADGRIPVNGSNLNPLISAASPSLDTGALINKLSEVETALFQSDNIVPMVFDGISFVMAEHVKDIKFSLNSGKVDFTSAGKRS